MKKKLMTGMLAAALAASPVLVCASEMPEAAGIEDAEAGDPEEFTESSQSGVWAEPVDEAVQVLAVPVSDEDVHPLRASDYAFAVYCETDGSFTFYADAYVPAAGSTYANKIVTEVYSGVDTDEPEVWADLQWYDICENVRSVSFDSSFADVQPVSTRYWFRYFVNCESIDLTNLDTSSVTDMQAMFRECEALTELDVSGMDVSKVKDMSEMFYGCSGLTSINVEGWDTGSATDMRSMFEECTSVTSFELGNWDTKNVTNMGRMFYECQSATSIDVSGWDTGKVTSITVMFWDCTSLPEIDVSSWNTANVSNMYCTFYRCRSLKYLDLTSWNSAKATTFSNFAITCSSLEWVEFGSEFDLFERSSTRLVSQLNWYDNNINGRLVSDNYMIGISEPGRYYTSTQSVFAVYCENDSSLIYYADTAVPAVGSTYSGRKVTNVYTGMEDTGTARPSWYSIRESVLTVSFDDSFAAVRPKSCYAWFDGFSNCTDIDLKNLDISSVTNMQSMFRGCSSLTYLDLDGWDTSGVSTYSTFATECSSLIWIRIGDGFDLFVKSPSALVSQLNWYDDPYYGRHVSYNYMMGVSGAGTYWVYSVYGFGLRAVAEDGSALSGVEFIMTDAGGDTCLFTQDGNTYTLCPSGTTGAVDTITVTADGVQFEGLTDEEYTLTETKAAVGYALLADPVVVTVGDTGISIPGGSTHAAVTGTWSMEVIHDTQAIVMPNTGDYGGTRLLLIGLAVLLCGTAGALRGIKRENKA